MNKNNRIGKSRIRKVMIRAKIFSPISIALSVAMAAGAAAFLYLFVIGAWQVRGDGMEPAVPEQSVVLSNKLAYSMKKPKRGDVVIASGHLLRVIGLPGESISINGGNVYVDGIELSEEYLKSGMQTYPVKDAGSCKLGEGEYYLLCDNRDCYDDSRSGRLFTEGEILSKVFFRF